MENTSTNTVKEDLIITNPFGKHQNWRYRQATPSEEIIKTKMLADNKAVLSKVFGDRVKNVEHGFETSIVFVYGEHDESDSLLPNGRYFMLQYKDTYMLMKTEIRRGQIIKWQISYDKPIDVKKYSEKLDSLLAAMQRNIDLTESKERNMGYYEVEAIKLKNMLADAGVESKLNYSDRGITVRMVDDIMDIMSVMFMKDREPQITIKENVFASGITVASSMEQLDKAIEGLENMRRNALKVVAVYEANKDILLK